MFTSTGHSEPYQQLRDISLFKGCSEKELRSIDKLVVRVDQPAGSVLCREGVHGRQTFVVVEGEVVVAVDGVAVGHLGPGSLFGEMSVIDATPRCATVTALTDVVVLVLAPQELYALMDVPAVLHRMLATMSGRLRLADRSLAAKTTSSPGR